jgi:uncharacterized protein YecA (UPF0149 family)
MKIFKSIVKIFSSRHEQEPERYPARNELCWCGSGLKYKKCHLSSDEEKAEKKAAACCIKS